MRAIRVASAALLATGALVCSAPTAAAGDHDNNRDNNRGDNRFGFRAQPSTIAAGGQVTLSVDRAGGNCSGTVIVSSGVFDTVRIGPDRSQATASVDWDARAGAVYRVTFTCNGGDSGSAALTIAGGRTREDNPYPRRDDNVYPYPRDRGVHAGEGGTIGGFDLKELGLGAALITGSLAAAYHFSRRRSGENGA